MANNKRSVPVVSNEFGIAFVPDEEVPPPPRQNDRNPALWKAVLTILRQHPGEWAAVREYDKPNSAGIKASNINNGRNKNFPNSQWEARYTKTETSSVLFLRYNGPKLSESEAMQASDVDVDSGEESTG